MLRFAHVSLEESLLSPRVVTAVEGFSFTIKALLFFRIKAHLCLAEATGVHGHACLDLLGIFVKSLANFHHKIARRGIFQGFFCATHFSLFFMVDLCLGQYVGDFSHSKDIYILSQWHKKSKFGGSSRFIPCPKYMLEKRRSLLSLDCCLG